MKIEWNLASHNKNKFDKTKAIEYEIKIDEYVSNKINYRKLKKDIKLIISFLDEQENIDKDFRTIKLKLSGFDKVKKLLNITERHKSLTLINKLGSNIFDTVLNTTIELAQEKGYYPKFTMRGFKKEDVNMLSFLTTSIQIGEIYDFGMRNNMLIEIDQEKLEEFEKDQWELYTTGVLEA